MKCLLLLLSGCFSVVFSTNVQDERFVCVMIRYFTMMKKINTLAIILFMIAGVSFRANGQVVAVNDSIKTGPRQIARIDVTKNDTIQCASHSQSIN